MHKSLPAALISALFATAALTPCARADDPSAAAQAPVTARVASPLTSARGSETHGQYPIPIPAPSVAPSRTFGQALLNDGIDFHGFASSLFLANPSAGVQPGHTASVQAVVPEVDLDLDKLAGIQGASLHVSEVFLALKNDFPQSALQTGGIQTGYPSLAVAQTNFLSELTYEQKLINRKLDIEFGRTAVFRYFFRPNGLDPLTAVPYTIYADGDINQSVYPVWGARAAYNLTKKWFVQAGAFEDNYYRAYRNGYDFGDAGASGAQILAEINYRSQFTDEAYPANLETGVEYNTRTGKFNVKGLAADYNPLLAARQYPGGGVIYLQGQKVIWRGRAKPLSLPENLALYGSVNVAVDKPQPVDLDAFVGLNYLGFIPNHPLDGFGAQVHYLRLSKIEADRESLYETFSAGRSSKQSRNGYTFELIGNVALTRWAFFNPYARYFITPDAYYNPFQGKPQDGVECGFYVTVSLGTLLGTSLKPF